MQVPSLLRSQKHCALTPQVRDNPTHCPQSPLGGGWPTTSYSCLSTRPCFQVTTWEQEGGQGRKSIYLVINFKKRQEKIPFPKVWKGLHTYTCSHSHTHSHIHTHTHHSHTTHILTFHSHHTSHTVTHTPLIPTHHTHTSHTAHTCTTPTPDS